jgi:hypothetical protein
VTPADRFRRGLGLVFVGGALLALVLGLTVWRDRLTPLAFAIHWSLCAVLALAALITALWDARVLRQRAAQERRELARRAAAEIAEAVKRKKTHDG